ncbi:MAG: hypothetical protein AAF850_13400 [Pseudomonadota bacterium]
MLAKWLVNFIALLIVLALIGAVFVPRTVVVNVESRVIGSPISVDAQVSKDAVEDAQIEHSALRSPRRDAELD